MSTPKSGLASQLSFRIGANVAVLVALWFIALLSAPSSARYWIAIGGALGIALSGWVAWSTLQQLQDAFRKPIDATSDLIAGDLTKQIDADGEGARGALIRAIKKLRDHLFKVVGDMQGRTKTVAAISAHLGRDNEALRTRTEMQLTSLQQITAAMDRLNAMVEQNSEQTRKADELVTSASRHARHGGTAMGEVVTTMGSIRESSRKIVDIIGLIDSIAFQTNILALNAAVEAARAGDHGHGFAVVASEVRTLAKRSATAAKEIKALIHSSVETVNVGSKLVDGAGKTMSEIVGSVEGLAGIVKNITHASDEQRSGIGEVNSVLLEMTRINKANAKMFMDMIRASTSLIDETSMLYKSLSGFNVGVRDVGTIEEAQALLARGVEFMQAHGKQALLDEINKREQGQFIERDLYLMVMNLDDYKWVAHGTNVRVLNYDSRNTKGPDGHDYMREMIDIAKTQGAGSVDYKNNHPITGEMRLKRTFVQRVGDICIGSGAYLE